MSERDDLPIISTPEDTKIEDEGAGTKGPSKPAEPRPQAPQLSQASKPHLVMRSEPSHAKPAVVKEPTEISLRSPAPAPAAYKTPSRPPTTVAKSSPPPPAPAPAPSKVEEPAPAQVEETSETAGGGIDEAAELLLDFQNRQNAALKKMEAVIGEHRKGVAERDALRHKLAQLETQLADAKKKLAAAEKAEADLKPVQQKLDAALLSNNMISSDLAKAKSRLAELETKMLTADDKVAATKKELDGALAALQTHLQAREEADYRVAAAVAVLQGKPLPERKAK